MQSELRKCIVLGSEGVGKTRICRIIVGDLNMVTTTTVGIDFLRTDIAGTEIHLLDTTGHERFEPIISQCYRMVDIVLFVYDVSRRETFARIVDNFERIKLMANAAQLYIIFGNRTSESERTISETAGKDLAEMNDALYFDVSIDKPNTIKRAMHDALSKFRTVHK